MIQEQGLNNKDWLEVMSKIKRANIEQLNYLRDMLIVEEISKRQ